MKQFLTFKLPRLNSRKLLLGLIIGSFSLDTFTNVLIITVAPYIQEYLNVTVFAISVLLSSFPLGVALGHLLFGSLVDRYGATLVFVSGPLLIFTASSASYLVYNSITLLTILFFLQALGVAAVCLAARVILYQQAHGDINLLAKYYSLEYLSFMISEILTPLIVTLLLLYSFWANVYLCSAGLSAFFAVNALKFVHNHPTLTIKQPSSSTPWLLLLLKNKSFVSNTLVAVGCYAWIYIYYVGLPYTLRFIFHLPTITYSFVLFINLLSALLAMAMNFYLLRYYSAQFLLLASALASVVASFIFLGAVLLDFQIYLSFVSVFVFMSFTVMITLANASALALENCTQTIAGKAAGIFGFSIYIAGFLSSLLTGLLLSLNADAILSLALLITLVICLVFAACSLLLI